MNYRQDFIGFSYSNNRAVKIVETIKYLKRPVFEQIMVPKLSDQKVLPI